MTPIKLQLAIFIDQPLMRPEKIGDNINDFMQDLFNTTPVITPIPFETPFEMAVVQMRSMDSIHELNISKNRIDYFVNESADIFKLYESNAKKIMNCLSRLQIGTTRLGFVFNYFIEDKNAIKTIATRYLKEPERLEEIGLRYNKPIKMSGYTLNNIIQINNSEKLVADKKPILGILINHDINTVPATKNIPHSKFESLLQNVVSNEINLTLEAL